MAQHKSSIYKAQRCRPSGGAHAVCRALTVPATTQQIGRFATPSTMSNEHQADDEPVAPQKPADFRPSDFLMDCRHECNIPPHRTDGQSACPWQRHCQQRATPHRTGQTHHPCPIGRRWRQGHHLCSRPGRGGPGRQPGHCSGNSSNRQKTFRRLPCCRPGRTRHGRAAHGGTPQAAGPGGEGP